MSRTFVPLVGSDTSEPYLVGHKWGYQTAEKLRQNLDTLAYLGVILDLGGSDTTGQLTASYAPVPQYRDYALNGTTMGGITTEAVVYSRTFNAGTSVTVRLRNTTASTTAATSTTITATSVTKEVLAVTLSASLADYRLEILGGNASAAVFAWGYLRFRRIPT